MKKLNYFGDAVISLFNQSILKVVDLSTKPLFLLKREKKKVHIINAKLKYLNFIY